MFMLATVIQETAAQGGLGLVGAGLAIGLTVIGAGIGMGTTTGRVLEFNWRSV